MPTRGQRNLEAICPGDRKVFGYGRAGRESREGRCFTGRVLRGENLKGGEAQESNVPDST
jgi:hypothetical protein